LPAAIICLANGQLETKEFLFAIYSPTNNDSQAFRSASLTCEVWGVGRSAGEFTTT